MRVFTITLDSYTCVYSARHVITQDTQTVVLVGELINKLCVCCQRERERQEGRKYTLIRCIIGKK